MPTYIDIVVRVQSDMLNRTTYSDQVKRAILSTIRRRERERFWFNETSTALVAVAGVATIAKPANFLFIDRLEVVENSNTTALIETGLGEIRDINQNASLSLPTHFTQYADQFVLANIPMSAYTVNCYYVKQLPVLVNDSDTNDWLSAAEDVIVYGAAKQVWAMTIRNASAAGVCAQMEMEALSELRGMRDQQQKLRLKPTRF
jgi:hypothetical protein